MPEQNTHSTIRVSSSLPVIDKADVVVVGGGTAGFVAAIAATRTGARTILIERNGFLGGCLNGTYATSPSSWGDSDGNQIIRGIGWEFIERMEREKAAIVDREKRQVQIFPETTKLVALEMVVEADVKLYLHSWASEIVLEDGVIQGIIMQSKSGRQVIMGKVFVDATGDADLAFWGGAPYDQKSLDEAWQTSVDLTVCNVDPDKVIHWANTNSDRIIGWSEIPEDMDHSRIQPIISFIVRGAMTKTSETMDDFFQHKGPVPTVKIMIHNSIARAQGSVETDATDAQSLTWAEIEGRKRAMAHLSYLKQNIPGFEDAFVVSASPLGVRETRRIIGDYILTNDDLLNNVRFPDVVALNSRALDRHLKGGIFQVKKLKGNHDIPLRSLIPQKVENLLVAGRCISSDHEANASLRGAATCMGTGHAAGTAAAIAAKENERVRDINVDILHRILKEQNVILSTG